MNVTTLILALYFRTAFPCFLTTIFTALFFTVCSRGQYTEGFQTLGHLPHSLQGSKQKNLEAAPLTVLTPAERDA